METVLTKSLALLGVHERLYKNASTGYNVLKRTLDVFLALVALVLLSPVFFIVALCVKLDSKGPAFFRQQRCCEKGKLFTMHKFRTMKIDAEQIRQQLEIYNEMDGPVFKILDDPRITRVGRILRKTSLDELPQLFNILKGDMTIVGPRPPLPREVEQYSPYQMQRLLVKPGLTCYWQVMGRNNLDFNTWIELDLKYIREMGLKTDLKIMFKTIPAVIKQEGAY